MKMYSQLHALNIDNSQQSRTSNKEGGDGFGNQSYLMVQLFTLATQNNALPCNKNNASSFSQCIYN